MLGLVTVAGAGLGASDWRIPAGSLARYSGMALDRHWRFRRWSDLPRRLA